MSNNNKRIVLHLGPQHPSTHGVLHLEVQLEGEIIEDIKIHIGYLHRCFEKHCEYLSYPKIIPFTDRLDYLSSMNNSHAFAMAVEKLLDIDQKIPERVEYIRVLVVELNRIASHLIALGTFAMDLGSVTPFMWCFASREQIISLLERVSGARLLYNYVWIGGLMYDIPEGFCTQVLVCIKNISKNLSAINKLLLYNELFMLRTIGVGVIKADQCASYGITGPMLRATGIGWDIRKEDGYSIYHKLAFDIPTGTDKISQKGDSWARCYVRSEEIKESIKIIEQCCEFLSRLTSSEKKFSPQALVPKKVRMLTDAEIYARVENPRGELGFFIATKKNSDVPLRVKVRPPSFNNLSVLPIVSQGHLLADLPVILGSFDIVLGEIDR